MNTLTKSSQITCCHTVIDYNSKSESLTTAALIDRGHDQNGWTNTPCGILTKPNGFGFNWQRAGSRCQRQSISSKDTPIVAYARKRKAQGLRPEKRCSPCPDSFYRGVSQKGSLGSLLQSPWLLGRNSRITNRYPIASLSRGIGTSLYPQSHPASGFFKCIPCRRQSDGRGD